MIYEIRFDVDTPVITTTDIHLDSLFYGISPAAHNKDFFVDRNTCCARLAVLPIPVDCAKIGKDFIYCCTAADYINAEAISDTATKRRDGEDYMYYHKQQTPRKGIDKDHMIKLYGVACSAVTFRCSSSNLPSLERYVKRLKNIGAMRKQGYGHITGYEITPFPEADWKDCLIENGRAARNIPESFLETEGRQFLRCFPPYWLPDGKVSCAAVGEFAALKDGVYLSPFKR